MLLGAVVGALNMEYTCDSGATLTAPKDDGFGTMDDDYENTIGATLGGGYYATSSCLVKILPMPSSSWPSGKGSCSYTTIDNRQGYVNTSCTVALHPALCMQLETGALGFACCSSTDNTKVTRVQAYATCHRQYPSATTSPSSHMLQSTSTIYLPLNTRAEELCHRCVALLCCETQWCPVIIIPRLLVRPLLT